MLTPRQLDEIPSDLVELYAEFETIVLNDIARRIRKTNTFTATASYQSQILIEMGLQQKFAIREIAKLTGKSQKEVKKMFKLANIKSSSFLERILAKAGFKKLDKNITDRIIETEILKTNNNLLNLTKTTAITSQQAFIKASNMAHLQITSGAFDFETAVKNAIKKASVDGATVLYPSGATRTIESAVRMVALTGVNQSANKVQERTISELGVDLVEVSAHAGARPTHADFQGKVYSYSGKSEKYPDFVSSTGYGTGDGLGGWNCKHSFYPFFEDESVNAYTRQQLNEYDAKNISYEGKKITEYEASQIQRYNERQIRKWKRQASSLKSGGIDNSFENSKIKEWQKKNRDFVKETGLIRDYPREQIG